MSKKKTAARQALRHAADVLSDEVWQGKWNHIPDLNRRPIPEWAEILSELEKRCPGHSVQAYEDALIRSHFGRR